MRGCGNTGLKSDEISLKNITQIFLKSSYYPRRRYEAHHRRDVKKISLRVLFEILRKSSIKFLLRSSWDLKKIFWRFISILPEDFLRRSSVHFWTFDRIFKTKNKKKDQKIFSRSQKDIRWRRLKDLNGRSSKDLQKILIEDLSKVSKRF